MEGGLRACFRRISRVCSARENRTLKRGGHNGSRYGSPGNLVFITGKLVKHLNILHNVYVMNQHFCMKVNVGSVETVRLEFREPDTQNLRLRIYDSVFRSQKCGVCGKVLPALRSRFGLCFMVFAA